MADLSEQTLTESRGWKQETGQAVTEAQVVAGGGVVVLPIRGRGLRFVLVEYIREREVMSVGEMTEALAVDGFVVGGRVSKVVSDSLRWEVARGRVKRVGRGVYAYGRAPVSTARRIRLFARHCRVWVVAVTRTQPVPPTPLTADHRRRGSHYLPPEDPNRTPWGDLRWLWTT